MFLYVSRELLENLVTHPPGNAPKGFRPWGGVGPDRAAGLSFPNLGNEGLEV